MIHSLWCRNGALLPNSDSAEVMMFTRLFLLSVILSSAAAVQADDMRCGASLISEDNTVAELVAKCGEPAEKRATTEDINRPGGPGRAPLKVGTVVTEHWYYDRGNVGPRMVVTIIDGKIKSVARETDDASGRSS
jgi:hypothetical protein